MGRALGHRPRLGPVLVPGRDGTRGRIALARHQLEQAYRFRYMVRNDDVERATDALSALVLQELAAAGTMAGS